MDLFDAPSHVIDFGSLDTDDNADNWFDQTLERLITPQREKPLGTPRRVDLTRAVVSPRRDDGNAVTDPNVVTSFGNAGPSTSGQNQRKVPSRQPRRVSKRLESTRRQNPRKGPGDVTTTPPIKKPRRSSPARPVRRSVTAGSQRRRRSVLPSSSTGRDAKLKSSEQQEVERMQAMQKEVAEHRRRNEASLKAAVTATQPVKKLVLSTTVPVEFHFRTDERLKQTDAGQDYKEVDFNSQLRKPLAAPANGPRGATIPKPFKLTVPAKLKRLVTVAYVSMAEQIQQFQKRMPVRYHLRSRQREEKEAFRLETDRRIRERQANRKPEEPQEQTFRPRPVPLRILEEVVGVPEKRVQHPTVPESPAFALKSRVRVEHKVEPEKPMSPVKANPLPHFGVPFLPKKTQVEVCPFSFEAREQERLALKEKRLEEMRNEVLPKFKAQPLPDFSAVHLPAKKVAAPTQVEPFQLMIDQRGATKSERWEKQMKEELKQQVDAAMFKARPSTVVHKEPFLPKKENRSIEGFQLNLERRAKERLEFDQALCEKLALRACIKEKRRKEEEEREQDEIAHLRQEQVYKAQPVRHYKPLELKRGEVPLTVPQSPNFSDRFRL